MLEMKQFGLISEIQDWKNNYHIEFVEDDSQDSEVVWMIGLLLDSKTNGLHCFFVLS